MRKGLFVFSALIVALLLWYRLTGEDALPSKMRIATGGESGVYSAYGDILAEILERRMNVQVSTIQSGGSVDNIRLLRNGRAEIAFVQNDIMTYAYEGTHIFSTDGPFKDFSAAAGLYPEICQIVARREIAGIPDLVGRRVSVGDEGSGTEQNALQILDSYGISYADIDVDHLSFGASVSALMEGRIDAFFCTAGVPTPAISDLAARGNVRLLSVGDAHARSLMSLYPFYSRQTIPGGVYAGIDDETETVAVKATLVVSNRLSGQVVADLLKILFESRAEIAGSSPEASGLSPESAVDGIPIPLHLGAESYFSGILK
ncbi:MAG: TAXI family TRAP transporter solute-binding subunit [Synergistaceae bacterium]|jgi:TRAP transporter TAXI family solute receptor|nr:TAXI family TRAP transporter solute-binding subunit [Synergistaceae bacterium]